MINVAHVNKVHQVPLVNQERMEIQAHQATTAQPEHQAKMRIQMRNCCQYQNSVHVRQMLVRQVPLVNAVTTASQEILVSQDVMERQEKTAKVARQASQASQVVLVQRDLQANQAHSAPPIAHQQVDQVKQDVQAIQDHQVHQVLVAKMVIMEHRVHQATPVNQDNREAMVNQVVRDALVIRVRRDLATIVHLHVWRQDIKRGKKRNTVLEPISVMFVYFVFQLTNRCNNLCMIQTNLFMN
jgi:hypothetical protein